MLGGFLLPSNMAAKTIFFSYLVKRLIVTLRCAVNVTASSFHHFPWSLSAKFVFRKRKFTILKVPFWLHDQLQTYSFLRKWCGLKNQITIILFKIWPTNRFSKAKSYNFHFHKNDVTWPLVLKLPISQLYYFDWNIQERPHYLPLFGKRAPASPLKED